MSSGSAVPSLTGQVVAVVRAGLTRPSTANGLADAQSRLCAGMFTRHMPAALRSHIEQRTRFFDEQVLAAIGKGIDQVVILGAGYDDRPLRFRCPGVRYFEVDHPVTQEDKRRRLSAIDADASVLVPVDLRTGDLAAELRAAGHDGGKPSLVLGEGLLVYLDRETAVEMLRAIGGRAARGSVLALSLAVHSDGAESAEVVRAANARRANGRAEPFRTILPAGEYLRLLADAGWRLVESCSASGADGAPRSTWLVRAEPAAVGETIT